MPEIFLNTDQAASLLNISPRTLERWRFEGKGPSFRKFGRRAMYAQTDLVEWAESRRRTSTAEVVEAA